jgi:chromosome partitioning protein
MQKTPKVIMFFNQKGGVGKTTLSINLAHCFKKKLKTAIIDLDGQGTTTELSEKIKGVPLLQYSSAIRSEDFDFVLIDTPPYLTDKLSGAFAQADLIIIPTQDGIPDLLACRRPVELVKAAMTKNKALKAAIVLNLVDTSSKLAHTAKTLLEKHRLPILEIMVEDKADLSRSVGMENGIYSIKNKMAQSDINCLANEILLMLQSH